MPILSQVFKKVKLCKYKSKKNPKKQKWLILNHLPLKGDYSLVFFNGRKDYHLVELAAPPKYEQ